MDHQGNRQASGMDMIGNVGEDDFGVPQFQPNQILNDTLQNTGIPLQSPNQILNDTLQNTGIPLQSPTILPAPPPTVLPAPPPSTVLPAPPSTQLSPHQLAYQQIHQQQQQQLQQHLQTFWANQFQEIQQITDFKNHTLPLARIKKIMKADEDVRMISAEAPVVFARACEMFILELTLRSWNHTEENKRRTLQKNDIAAAITRTDIFDFLVDIVPREDMKDEMLISSRAGGSSADGLPYYYMPQQIAPAISIGKPLDQTYFGQQQQPYTYGNQSMWTPQPPPPPGGPSA